MVGCILDQDVLESKLLVAVACIQMRSTVFRVQVGAGCFIVIQFGFIMLKRKIDLRAVKGVGCLGKIHRL